MEFLDCVIIYRLIWSSVISNGETAMLILLLLCVFCEGYAKEPLLTASIRDIYQRLSKELGLHRPIEFAHQVCGAVEKDGRITEDGLRAPLLYPIFSCQNVCVNNTLLHDLLAEDMTHSAVQHSVICVISKLSGKKKSGLFKITNIFGDTPFYKACNNSTCPIKVLSEMMSIIEESGQQKDIVTYRNNERYTALFALCGRNFYGMSPKQRKKHANFIVRFVQYHGPEDDQWEKVLRAKTGDVNEYFLLNTFVGALGEEAVKRHIDTLEPSQIDVWMAALYKIKKWTVKRKYTED